MTEISAQAGSSVVPSIVQNNTETDQKYGKIHNASQQVDTLRQVLEDNKQKIGFFLGAGCPLGVYDNNGTESLNLIPDIKNLTTQVIEALDKEDANASSGIEYRKAWDAICKECKGCREAPACGECHGQSCPIATVPTVEDVLTELRILSSRKRNSNVLDMTKDALNSLDDIICSSIKGVMSKELPSHRCSYTRFASWIGGVARSFPVELFTPNYDLLFEQAFERQSLPHFDGFVGTREPWFDLASIEHDVIPLRWTRLWKLHGSINWEQIEEIKNGKTTTRVVRVAREAQKKVMIYPSHLKYDQSRRMPYLAMLDRLRAFFRGESSGRGHSDQRTHGSPRLIICGYSFIDDHFNEILLDGLRGNLKAQCFALMYSTLDAHERAVEYAKSQPNLTVLASDGAVVGTRVGQYRAGTSGDGEHLPWLHDVEVPTDETTFRHVANRVTLYQPIRHV